MLVAVPPAQPAVPLAADAIVEKVLVGRPRHVVRTRAAGDHVGHHAGDHVGHHTGDHAGHHTGHHAGHHTGDHAGHAGHHTGHHTGHHAGHGGAYRLAGASWYGGGGSLACGGMLTSSTRGVANKTLPCGTVIFLRYRGRKVEVPVIDRGPFVAGREFDLTEATKRALGFGDTGEVWWRVR